MQSAVQHVATKTLKESKESEKSPEKRVSSRKPLKPMPSANRCDPKFRGVILQMKTTLTRKSKRTGKSQAQLVIDCVFSVKKKRRSEEIEIKTPRRRISSSSQNSTIFKLNRSSEDLRDAMDLDLGVEPIHISKECVSCGTCDTPLWRDTVDGTPLCNACGILYKKYRVRCVRCWYIPKKGEKALPYCTSCGHTSTFKITLGRRENFFTRNK